MEQAVRGARRLRGTLRVPGDKSISHRAALLAALADGPSRIRAFLAGEDCLATLRCLRALGIQWRLADDGTLQVAGAGLHGLREPEDVLDCGNSGTTMRLLSGIAAGQPFVSVLTGDASLRSRPMERVAAPLRLMGATIAGRAGGLAPLTIAGGPLHGIRYRLPVASAQVKSAVLLAGLFAAGETVVEEPAPSRDHTERMLERAGVDIRREGPAIRLAAPSRLEPLDMAVPADVSSAAFWMVAAAVHPDAELRLTAVGLNPTRTGLLDVLREMGADIAVEEERTAGGETAGDVVVRSSRLRGVEVGGEMIPRLIDEVPALAVAACFADGRTTIRDAGELRVKESDRIAAVAGQLRALGARIEELPDGLTIDGGSALQGTRVDSGGDHRLAMALAVAGLLADGETLVAGAEAADVSYPAFWRDLQSVVS